MVLSKSDLIYFISVFSTALLILIFFFVSLIIVNVKRRKQDEIEKLNAIISAEDSERSRIAKDMHDELGPLLSGIKLQINMLARQSSPEVSTVLGETEDQLDYAIDNIRYIVRNLMPPGLRKYGLIKSIDDFKNIVARKKDITFTFTHARIDDRFNETAELNIFRIIYELINNSLKHSNCTLITLNLELTKDIFKLQYHDNGNVDNMDKDYVGMGLSNIESRVNLFDGKIAIPVNFKNGSEYLIEIDRNKLI